MLFIQALALLALRVALALPFWLAGLTRWEGFLALRPEALDFFMSGYRPDLGGQVYSLPQANTAAMIIASAEIILPAALVIGFATRLSALGLLILTAIIFAAGYSGIAFPGYPGTAVGPDFWQATILPWGAMALALIAYGAGLISFDRLIWESAHGR